MAVKLRLRRMGRKKQPFYRIVAIDALARRDGKYIEKIGHYNPLPDPVDLLIDTEKALKWLNEGAVPSDTVKSLLRRKGILQLWDMQKRGLSEEQVAEEMAKREKTMASELKKKEAEEAMKKRDQEEEAKKAEALKATEAAKKAAAEKAAAEEAPAEEAPAEEAPAEEAKKEK